MKLSYFWRNFDYILVGLVVVGFFLATAAFNYQTQTPDYVKFLSPDETANYFFARHYAETGEVSVFEPANLIAEEIVHPRSIRSDHGWLKPVSFLGIILVYGKIGAWLGTGAIPYLTPFFGAVGLLFFYGFVRKLFGRRNAAVAVCLLASFPVYFFYTARSLFHNVLLIVFLLGAAYSSLFVLPDKNQEKKKFWQKYLPKAEIYTYGWSLLTGLMIGGAIGTRASELLWLGPVLLLVWLFYARRFGFTRLVITLGGVLLALLPVFYWNQILYTSPFYGGYGEMNKSILELSQAGGQFLQSTVSGRFQQYQQAITTVTKTIFYFGCHPRQSLWMFFYYVVKMFPLLCFLSFAGGLIFLVRLLRRPKRGAWLYLLTWLLLSSILILYYGSWKFNDNPDPARYTIGNSYTRYWLPLYILALPLAALAITSFSRLAGKVIRLKDCVPERIRARRIVAGGTTVILTGVWMSVSLLFTVFGSEEGLMTLYYNSLMDKENAGAIIKMTEPEAIIVTQYHDKQLFPERRVVNALLINNEVNASLGRILRYYPIYYYNFFLPEKDLKYLNERKLPPFGFTLKFKERRGVFGLYKLELKK